MAKAKTKIGAPCPKRKPHFFKRKIPRKPKRSPEAKPIPIWQKKEILTSVTISQGLSLTPATISKSKVVKT